VIFDLFVDLASSQWLARWNLSRKVPRPREQPEVCSLLICRSEPVLYTGISMKKVPIVDIAGNVYFSEATYLDSGYVLTSPDVVFTRSLRNRLVEWGFRNVYTEGDIVDEAPQVDVEEQADPGEITKSYEDEQNRKQAIEFFRKTVTYLEETFDRFRERDELRLSELTETVKDMMAELKANRRYMLSLDDASSPAKTYLATHSVKTAILAIALSEFLKYPPFKQIDLGLAGLLHEIGLLKIPDELYLSDRQLTVQEKKTLMAHPVLGYRILKTAGFPANACVAVLEHNERLDGSGLPRRLNGEQISEYGRILAVATSYNAATSSRPYKEGIDGHSGVMDLLKDAGKRYDEKALTALVYTLSLYPIGTYVRMSNGAIGIVVQANERNPKYPAVKLVVDERGNRYAEQPVVQTREGDEVKIDASLTRSELLELTARK